MQIRFAFSSIIPKSYWFVNIVSVLLKVRKFKQ